MKVHWIGSETSAELLIFCNGWGMDHHPFLRLNSTATDVAICYDYRSLKIPRSVTSALRSYQTINLVGWSMGVWTGQYLFSGYKDIFATTCAINGTLNPIDDQFGIPVELFEQTLATYSDETRDRFYRRMCKETGIYELFSQNPPRRTAEDQKEELLALKEYVNRKDLQHGFYKRVMISTRDRIVPTSNQKTFWYRCKPIELTGCHFPFARWDSWRDLLQTVENDG